MASKTGQLERLRALEEICSYSFHDHDRALAAITHPSAVEKRIVSDSYERLEFLGDSILGAVVAKHLYDSNPFADEGELTRVKNRLVWGETLALLAEQIGLAPLILMGESELGTGSRGMRSALENVYEAVVGALFLDGGVEVAREFIMSTLMSFDALDAIEQSVNPKSKLQEMTQKHLHCEPEYQLVAEEGPAHNPTFTTVVKVEGRRVGKGSGPSKKASEAAAAKDALARLGFDEPAAQGSE